MIGHLVAGCLVIISGLCLLGFVISVWVYNICRKERNFLQNLTNTTATGRQYQLDYVYVDCADREAALFKQYHVLFGGVQNGQQIFYSFDKSKIQYFSLLLFSPSFFQEPPVSCTL